MINGKKPLEQQMDAKRVEQTQNVKQLTTSDDAYSPERRIIRGEMKTPQGAMGKIQLTTDHVNLKEEAKNLNEDDRKELYIMDYFKNQGIMMEKEKIISNPGMREIAKLCLNSLWGKFGQRTNMSKCEIVNNKEQFWKIAKNPEVINLDWVEIGEGEHSKKQIRYEIKEEYLPTDFNTNIAIASFTTSSARLKLYNEFLKPLGRQVLYFDTDSIVYVYNPNDPTKNKTLKSRKKYKK